MKTAVVYWSGTGNTEAMAEAVANGARAAGADVTMFTADAFNADAAAEFEAVAMQATVKGGLKAEIVPTVNVEKRGGEGAGGFELVGVGGTVECLAAKVFGLGAEL